MSIRILTVPTAAGILVVGAAALGGCTSNGGSEAAAGATHTVAVVAHDSGTGTGSDNGDGTKSGTSTQQATSGGDPRSCTGDQLSLKITPEGSETGHADSVLVFTNTGSDTCSLYGYPGADVTNSGEYNWAPYLNATRVSGGPVVKTVRLPPGSSASALLEWDVHPNSGAGDTANAANCAAMAGGYLEITPPDTTSTRKSEPPEDMCTDLRISPVVAGADGR